VAPIEPNRVGGDEVNESLRRTWGTGLGLALISIALYAPLIGWGAPMATAPNRIKTFATDEILPLEALAEMRNTFVASRPDRNYGYPWWHYFVVAVSQSPYLAYLWLSGELQAPSPEYPFGLKDPVRTLRWLTLIGRMVSVLMGAGIVIAAYYFANILWGRLAGAITASLTSLNYLMFYYSRTGNLDVPAFFWSAIGLAIFAKIMVAGLTVQRAAWFGVFAGLAMATKDQAVVIFLPLGFCLLAPWGDQTPGAVSRWRPLVAGLAASLAAYAVGTGLIVDPQRHLTHVHALLFDPRRLSAAGVYWPPHPRTLTGTISLFVDYLGKLAQMASPPVLIAAVAGALLALRSRPRLLILLLPSLFLFVMLILPTGIVVLRYLLPLALLTSAFAAYALIEMRRSRLRPLWIPSLVILCGWQLLVGADLAYAQYRDTRYAAAAWIDSEMRSGERIEYFGAAETMPYLRAEIVSGPVAGRAQWVGEFGHGPAVLQYLSKGGPEYVAVIPDWTSQPGMDRSADCPTEVYAALKDGSAGYAQAAFFPSRSLFAHWFPEGWRLRPPLDNPSVCPPVRIFARLDVLGRVKQR
jgi:hypothetical protein